MCVLSRAVGSSGEPTCEITFRISLPKQQTPVCPILGAEPAHARAASLAVHQAGAVM